MPVNTSPMPLVMVNVLIENECAGALRDTEAYITDFVLQLQP